MGAKPVSPQNGSFTIRGKNNNNLKLTLETTELDKFIVEELDGADMDSKLPSKNPLGIDWFACFSVYDKKKDGKKGGYATVKYSFEIALAENERFFVAYNNTAYDVTDEMKKGKVTLSQGDPAAGVVPPRI